MVSPDSRYGRWESISNIYITKIVVLVFEPVRGRSRVTELPCFISFSTINKDLMNHCFNIKLDNVSAANENFVFFSIMGVRSYDP